MFVDEVGEAGGVCVDDAAASPGSAFTRIIAGIVGVDAITLAYAGGGVLHLGGV